MLSEPCSTLFYDDLHHYFIIVLSEVKEDADGSIDKANGNT